MGAHENKLTQNKARKTLKKSSAALAVVGTVVVTIVLNLVIIGLGVAVVVFVLQALGVL